MEKQMLSNLVKEAQNKDLKAFEELILAHSSQIFFI